ncbi:MAG: GWxTD domain-containing protein, partial [Balneolales bacterium]|nr:GWxTD domain-containing protein [Balneolales bacterium]
MNCSNSYVEGIDRTGLYQYRPGFPELNVSTAGFIDDLTDSTFINVSTEVLYSSLVFKKVEDEFQSEIVLQVQILDEINTSNILSTKDQTITITLPDQSKIQDQSMFSFTQDFFVEPGQYKINVSVADLSTNKQTVRTSTVFIPNPFDEISHITNIRIFSKETDELNAFTPATTYDLASTADSIRFSFQVTNNNPEEPLIINSRLIKFNADTSSARPLSWPNYTSSSLPYVGISYTKYEIVSSSRRVITQPGSVTIEFLFPGLPRGNYRFEVQSESNEELFRAREFSVKSENYPTLRTAKELAAPLIYLMDQKDHKKMMEIEDPLELKQEIDRFWLSNIKNPRIAGNVVELYYSRVEEANKQFSNYKEGWKTDFGMMYILFGPPRYVTNTINQIVWSYTTNLSDPESSFLFEAPRIRNKY